MKKHFKKNVENLNGFFDYMHETFSNDTDLLQQSNQIFTDLQDHFRRCLKNEKTLNNFMGKLPQSLSSFIEPDDFQRIIIKEEDIHNELQELFTQFVSVVKEECVMNVHFFSFTGLPDVIVKKNYTRAQYQSLTKLLISVKNAYLQQRARTEAENVDEQKQGQQQMKTAEQNMTITEEDLVELQLLDDFLTQHERSFEQKKALWRFFIQSAKDQCK